MEKEQGQTVQPVAPQGLSDLSLLCHKGTASPSHLSVLVMISRRCKAIWVMLLHRLPWMYMVMLPIR